MRLGWIEKTTAALALVVLLGSIGQAYAYKRVTERQTAQYQANVAYLEQLRQYHKKQRKYRQEREERYRRMLLEQDMLRQQLSSPERAPELESIPEQTGSSTALQYDKLIVADLQDMRVHTYVDGVRGESYEILSKGKKGSRWETPAGRYAIATKERNHFSSIGQVNMPFSMQFFGNFFIHGWPTEPDGTPVPEGYSGGCIRLSTADAEALFNFADIGVPLLVVNTPHTAPPTLSIKTDTVPRNISASSYIVADIDTGTIYASKDADTPRPIASVSKLVTALVANATIRYDARVPIIAGPPITPSDYRALPRGVKMRAVDTIFPLLLESNNAVAHALARYNGTKSFIRAMHTMSRAIGMEHASFADASGISPRNRASARDLYKLARYLVRNQSFILNVTRTRGQDITVGGHTYHISNHNHFANDPHFVGGKTGYTTAAGQTMLTVFNATIDGETRRVAIIILNSSQRKSDVKALYNWFVRNAHSTENTNTSTTTDTGETLIIGSLPSDRL